MSNLQAEVQLIESALGRHLFVVDGSRIYDIDDKLPVDAEVLAALLREIAPRENRRIKGETLAPPPLATLSLNVAQVCNMGCSYCYADKGQFGGKARLMSVEIARAAVDRLITESKSGADLVIGFMGGEPFLNKTLLHSIVPYAEDQAIKAEKRMRFSLTTNATLIDREDIMLMLDHDFQIAISLDGPPTLNDVLRPMNGKKGSSHKHVERTLELFAKVGRPRHLSARATVTPMSTTLTEILDHLLSLGFDSAGFAPVLVSPDPKFAFQQKDFDHFLEQMIACGEIAKQAILKQQPYPFSNFETALHELERGSHRPYPCGAGAAYLSVNAEGEMFACHRLIDNPEYAFGSVGEGSDLSRRAAHLAKRHVDRQEPCCSCWARYLCGGGCYHEVDLRGRIACNYIRGWLRWCIAAYAEIKAMVPAYFDNPDAYFNKPASKHRMVNEVVRELLS